MWLILFQNHCQPSYLILAPTAMTHEKDPKVAAKICFDTIGLDPELYRIGHTKASANLLLELCIFESLFQQFFTPHLPILHTLTLSSVNKQWLLLDTLNVMMNPFTPLIRLLLWYTLIKADVFWKYIWTRLTQTFRRFSKIIEWSRLLEVELCHPRPFFTFELLSEPCFVNPDIWSNYYVSCLQLPDPCTSIDASWEGPQEGCWRMFRSH